MDKWLKRPLALDSGQGSEEPTEKRKKEAKLKPRQYSETYIIWIHFYFCGPTAASVLLLR